MALHWNWNEKVGEIKYVVMIPNEGEKEFKSALKDINSSFKATHF